VRLRTPDHLRLRPKPKRQLVLEPAIARLAWLDGYDEARPFRDRVLSNLPLLIGGLLAAALIAVLLVLRH
jgi:Ser/Thr protein kinase RdoA (MazF antagonist)